MESASDRWRVAVEAAGVGTFDWDLGTGRLRYDDLLLGIFGVDAGAFGGTIEDFHAAVHPEDLPAVTAAIDAALLRCGDYAAEYRIMVPGQDLRWVVARGRVVAGADGTPARMVGVAFDDTTVQDSETRVTRVVEAMPTAFFHLDRDWTFRYVNRKADELLGGLGAGLTGGNIWELFPDAVGSDFEEHYRRAVRTGEPVSFDAYYPPPLDAWFEVRAWPTADGLSVYFNDVTDKHAAQVLLRRESRRSALMADVAEALTGSLDPEEGVHRLAQVLVPELADWCVVTLVATDGPADWRARLRDVGWWHHDPAVRPALDRYAECRVAALTDGSFVARALRTEQPLLVPAHAVDAIERVLLPGEARDLVRVLAPESAAVAPLRGRGRTVGLLSLFRGADREPLDGDDLELLAEVASRAGLHVDNVRLYAEQRDLAEGLQRSMMSAPATAGDVEVAVRYEAASQAAQVGGDWYDAFAQRDGATVLVIGDVVGHDLAAAAAMGQVRSLLRGIAVHTGTGPAGVLRGVDEAMEALGIATTATAAMVRLEPVAGSDATRVRWSNAGHPPPVVVAPDGTSSYLVEDEAGLLLGLQPDVRRTESVVEVPAGSVVLLYTDGLVERRGQSIDVGLELLGRTLTELRGPSSDLGSFCDALLERMVPGRREDDVALVAVHLAAPPGN